VSAEEEEEILKRPSTSLRTGSGRGRRAAEDAENVKKLLTAKVAKDARRGAKKSFEPEGAGGPEEGVCGRYLETSFGFAQDRLRARRRAAEDAENVKSF
jgi:hypothetical protein